MIDYLIGILRAFPVIVLVSFFSGGIIFKSPFLIYYAIWSLIEDAINSVILKPFFRKQVYREKETTLSYLGRGHRPDGARFCGPFISTRHVCNPSCCSSYGMPSGHAQVGAAFAVFWTLWLLQNGGFINSVFQIFYLWVISIAVSLSRIFLGCHTGQQVIAGNFFGLLLGWTGFNLFKRFQLLN